MRNEIKKAELRPTLLSDKRSFNMREIEKGRKKRVRKYVATGIMDAIKKQVTGLAV